MTSSLIDSTWLWVPLVLFAALAQTARNAAQRSLTQAIGTLPATMVRFLYGLPFALLWLGLLYWLTPRALPQFSLVYLGWIALGALFQVGGTAMLLLAMRERNFAVAVTLSKTEVLQVALFATVFLHELPTVLSVVAMVTATVGVLVLSLPSRDKRWSLSAWFSRSALYGLACGAFFAVAAIGFRGGALALGESVPWINGAWGVVLAQTLQSIVLGGWVAWRHPGGLAPVWRAWRVSLIAGSMGAAASMAWFSAYAMQGAAQVRTLGMVEVVFSYLVSRRLLQEKLSRAEQGGLALVGAGLLCLGLQL